MFCSSSTGFSVSFLFATLVINVGTVGDQTDLRFGELGRFCRYLDCSGGSFDAFHAVSELRALVVG